MTGSKSLTFAAVLALATAACGGRQGTSADAEACDTNFPADFVDNLLRRPVDTNGDCAADFWKLYEVLDDDDVPVPDVTVVRDPANYHLLANQRIRQKWLDLDFDGRPDVLRFYDTHERLVEQHVDVDFDGVIDRRDRFDEGIVNVRESDSNRDGVADVTRYYRGGELHRMEIDSDADGQPDTWRFYDEGHLLRIGEDTDGDEDIDTWLRRPTATRAPAPSTATPGDTPAESGGAGEPDAAD